MPTSSSVTAGLSPKAPTVGFLRAYLQQSHEMLFDAHNHAFAILGGVPERGIYDNMKTAVDRVGRGKLRTVNTRFKAMVSHFLFEAEFCNPAAGWEKGLLEKNVRDARHRLWHDAPRFKDLDAPQPEPVQTPPALRLVEEPKANTQRYDHLRRKNHVH